MGLYAFCVVPGTGNDVGTSIDVDWVNAQYFKVLLYIHIITVLFLDQSEQNRLSKRSGFNFAVNHFR